MGKLAGHDPLPIPNPNPTSRRSSAVVRMEMRMNENWSESVFWVCLTAIIIVSIIWG